MNHAVGQAGDDKGWFRISVVFPDGNAEIGSHTHKQQKHQNCQTAKGDCKHPEGFLPAGQLFFL